MKRAMVLGAGGEVCFRRGVVRFLRFGSDCTGVTRAFIERSLLSAPYPALCATFPASRRRRRATGCEARQIGEHADQREWRPAVLMIPLKASAVHAASEPL